MCGIFGFDLTQVNMPIAKKAIMSALLCQFNDSRGGHSYGFCDLSNREPKIKRGLGDSVKYSYNLIKSNMFFGHTRFATHGPVDCSHAHPFEIGNIIGAHNGILYNHEELNEKYERDYKVDSQHLIAHLSSGISFKDIEGYGSIEWVDKKMPNRIYLCRLKGGELAVAEIKDGNGNVGTVWSSDRDHLHTILSASQVSFVFCQIGKGKVYYVEGGQTYVTNKVFRLKEYIIRNQDVAFNRKLCVEDYNKILLNKFNYQSLEDNMPNENMRRNNKRLWG